MVLKNNKKTPSLLLNENIPFDQVLLVGTEKIILSKQEALQKAQEVNLSLLCVAPRSNPPVCKLIDYQKYIFELNKKKTKKVNTNKEINISFVISDNDLRVKLSKIHHWLEEKYIVKVNLVRKGREKTQLELAHEKCQKIIAQLKLQSPKVSLSGDIHSQAGSLYFFLNKSK